MSMKLEDAFVELFGKNSSRDFSVTYGRLRGYNARVRMTPLTIDFQCSKAWRGVSPEIQKGLFQVLLSRLFKHPGKTLHMDLYHNFIRSLPRVAPKTHNHPVLEGSFQRVNAAFFAGLMDQPNLRLGKGINRLGTYEYATDTLKISGILLEHPELMDYVMYHELLHKKHQYKAGARRHTHHSAAFRTDEARFPRAAELEKELERLVRQEKSLLSWW
ncbi:M48 family metallopeptidase [Candidatus Woesearchaeota archaeon]|nr:M48 family metallopeptidase [Candidatus Woesearchaeota archaeon]